MTALFPVPGNFEMGGDISKWVYVESTFRSFPLPCLLPSTGTPLPLHFLVSVSEELSCDSRDHLFLCSTSPQLLF